MNVKHQQQPKISAFNSCQTSDTTAPKESAKGIVSELYAGKNTARRDMHNDSSS